MISTCLALASLLQAAPHPWPHQARETLAEGIPAPPGFHRVPEPPDGFGAWLRTLPLKPAGTPVRLYDGRRKGNQAAHARVIDLDVGKSDHQQCADAVMRLRAEYLFTSARREGICFRATNGAPLPWAKWKAGARPRVAGRTLTWKATAAPDAAWATFRRYLDFVFVYAGTYSLQKELLPVPDGDPLRAGEVFIQGGFPGHAVIVLDVAENDRHQRVFLLGQSYMPAQDLHVLAGPAGTDPWYPFPVGDTLATPEWTFAPAPRQRFSDDPGCPAPRRRR
jgi:hypothetical protein